MKMTDLASKKCVPCEVGTPPLLSEKAQEMLKEVDGWELVDDKEGPTSSVRLRSGLRGVKKLSIRKKFKFDTYMDGINFVNKIAKVAEREDHHPDLEVGWRRVTVNFMTHNIGGLSENDFVMAAKVDKIK